MKFYERRKTEAEARGVGLRKRGPKSLVKNKARFEVGIDRQADGFAKRYKVSQYVGAAHGIIGADRCPSTVCTNKVKATDPKNYSVQWRASRWVVQVIEASVPLSETWVGIRRTDGLLAAAANAGSASIHAT